MVGTELEISGIYTSDKLQEYLFVFINIYILCNLCLNPETTIFIKSENLYLDCISCGATTKIEDDSKYYKSIKKEIKNRKK